MDWWVHALQVLLAYWISEILEVLILRRKVMFWLKVLGHKDEHKQKIKVRDNQH